MIKISPLLALLLACALHILAILGIRQVLLDIKPIHKTIPITLIQLPLPAKKKPVAIAVNPPAVTTDITHNQAVVKPILPKVKPIKKRNSVSNLTRAASKAVVKATNLHVSSSKPTVHTKAVVPKASVQPETKTPQVEPMTTEVKSEPVTKTIKPEPTTTEVTPQLSLDDLSSQIAQASEKIVNQSASAMENRVKTVKSVKSHQYLVNQYIRDWQQKVERIGNFNYPQAAREKDLAVKLTLEVGVNADGSIHSMQIRKSSGDAQIDEAAKKIVQMSAPFPALPPALREELDVLMIRRVWQFSDELGIR